MNRFKTHLFWPFCIMVLFSMFIPVSASARVNWLFQAGGMYDGKAYGANYDLPEGWIKKGNTAEVGFGLYLQIPVSSKIPMYIETGLGYRYKYVLSVCKGGTFNQSDIDRLKEYQSQYNKVPWVSGWDSFYGSFLEMPVKVGYELKMNDKNSFRFGLGPYASLLVGGRKMSKDWEKDIKPSCFSAGMTVSAEYKHRCMSFGVSYGYPVFYNGIRNHYANNIQVTIGINFHIGKINTDALLIGLQGANAVLGTMTDTYMQYQEMRNQYNGNSSSEGGSYSTGKSNSRRNSSSDGKGNSLSEQTSYNRDKLTYEQYDSDIAAAKAGNKPGYDIVGAQKKMKQLREKWEKRGKSWTRSNNEN